MKKLPLFVVLWTMITLLWLGVFLARAQTVEGTVALTEVETLQISIMMKDLLLAQQRIQILQTQFQAVVVQRDQAQTELVGKIQRLRVAHQAPEDKFRFDSATLTFVPLEKDAAETPPTTP